MCAHIGLLVYRQRVNQGRQALMASQLLPDALVVFHILVGMLTRVVHLADVRLILKVSNRKMYWLSNSHQQGGPRDPCRPPAPQDQLARRPCV